MRLFRRIRKNDALFLKMCVFRERLVNLCVVRGNVVNYWENIQIIPLGSVRLFRRIRKNDTPFRTLAELEAGHEVPGLEEL